LAGISVDVMMSSHTVGRAIIKGGVAADIQLAFELANSTDATIGMDGTTHKHVTIESKYIHIGKADSHGNYQHKSLLVGVDPAVDHKSETQIAGWLSKFQDIADVFGSSPLAQRQGIKLKVNTLLGKLRGMHSDHAKDQKKVFKLFRDLKADVCFETLGAEKYVETDQNERDQLMRRNELKLILMHGGSSAWNSIPFNVRNKKRADM
jgi:hypothetical protein